MTTAATNRLNRESSPYLLQHADNPVHWRPWGDAAFDEARREDRPIFLSVGYSTCHWCHVMAHESFESERVAAALNAHFVPVKVDREELTDVDAQYMLATQAYYALSGNRRGGGWPNSVWLMPDGRPFFAGTYFPREQFVAVLSRLHELWRDERPQIEQNAEVITRYMHELSGMETGGDAALSPALIERAVATITSRFDAAHGGFGTAPKFPPHGSLALLAAHYRRTGDDRLLRMHAATLDAMARGGIYDHVGGGFHRYATDARWFLPHFEKMLYDNAQLIAAYTDGWRFTGDERYRAVVAGTFDWIDREMTDPEGGFYAALDADSEGEEGRFYVWQVDEIREALGDDAGTFIEAYNIEPAGNWTEEATGEPPGTNIPHLAADPPAEQRSKLAALRERLRERRDRRPRPHLDDKVLTGWNGLLIGALAQAGRWIDQPRYTAAAARAADFLLRAMREPTGRLLRTWRGGLARLPGYLDDYAYLADGLIDLHEATGDPRWLGEARAVVDAMIERFEDCLAGAFFYTAVEHDGRVMRSKNPSSGGNMPSPNGVAAGALLRLGRITGEPRYTLAGHRTLRAFAPLMADQPYAAESLLVAADLYLHDAGLQRMVEAEPSPRGGRVVSAEADAPADVAAGQAIRVTVRVAIAEPYHIYGPDVRGSGVLPTRLVLLDGPATLGTVEYPTPRTLADPAGNGDLPVYVGSIALDASLTLPADASGEVRIVLGLDAQPCDDRACLAPVRVAIPLRVSVRR